MSNQSLNNADFIKQYAAEIAEALRNQEESPQQPSIEESVPNLYRSLCFDEPMIDDISNFPVVASALSRQLQSLSSPYAISDRLVNGILFLCKKRNSNNAPETKKDSPTAESTAIARLAFCVSIQLPLQICQNFESLSTTKTFLGSYKGNLNAESDINNNDKTETFSASDAAIQQQVDKISEAITNGVSNIEIENTTDQEDDDDSLKEVWAAESDPSDYDYDEGIPHIPQQQLHFQEDDWLDPRTLSKPDPTLTLDQAQLAVGSLLKLTNFTMLEPLLTLPKKEVETYMSELTQLILILLQPQTPLGKGDNKSMDLAFQDAVLMPLWILRDIAFHNGNSQAQRESFTLCYLEILQTLLAVDQAHLQDLGGRISNPNVELCTASIVGLSALSSWCSMTDISNNLTITSILDAMNDITHVVERATAKYKNNLLYSLVPILELLSGISSDKAKPHGAALSNSIAQTLLNSGFLRQLLVLGLEENVENAYHFHHALWGLSFAHPKIVGKYVARYSTTPQLVRKYTVTGESASRDCVSSILWNGFGWFHCGGTDEAPAPRVVWKKSSIQTTKQQPLTRDECTEVCQKSWTRLCKIVETSISDFSRRTGPEKILGALHDFERLLISMSVPCIASSFVQLLDSSHLQDITKALSLLSKESDEEAEIVKESEMNDNAEDPDDKLKDSKGNHQQVVSMTRKLLKQYTLFFQGNTGGSSKTD